MANTYTQIHLQFVFAPKFRQALIRPEWEDELYRYITGIVQTNKHKLLCINGMPDHVHMLIGLRTHQSIADLIQNVKGSSSEWINKNRFLKSRFEWQAGYGAFSYTKSMVSEVAGYIGNQKEHHKKLSFKEEYLSLLEEFEVEYKPEYLFQEPLE